MFAVRFLAGEGKVTPEDMIEQFIGEKDDQIMLIRVAVGVLLLPLLYCLVGPNWMVRFS